MSDLTLLQKTESSSISDHLKDTLSKQFADTAYTREGNATLLAAGLASEKSTLPSLPQLSIVEEPPSHPKYFGSIPEITAFGGALAMRSSSLLGAGLMVGAGGYQAYKDFGYLSQSDTLLQRSKFTGALLTDASMISGGVLTVAKYGPKWLAPALMVGGFAGRVLLDLVPDHLSSSCKK